MNGLQNKLGGLIAPLNLKEKPQCSREIQEQVKRFPYVYQNRMLRFASWGRTEADLMFGYPAFAFALATQYGREGDSSEILGYLRQGQSSKELADLYGLPRWLRKLPPEAFLRHIPDFTEVNKRFHDRMMAFVPTNPDIAAQWFVWVMNALEVEGEAFALWLAAQPLFHPTDIMPQPTLLAPLFIYAGYSTGELKDYCVLPMERRWSPKMKIETVLGLMQRWFGQLNRPYFEALENYRKDPRHQAPKKKKVKHWKPWIKESYCLGFHFVPLLNIKALVEEGQKMHHCVGTYGGLVRTGHCAIYSVRDKHHNRVATLELRHSDHDATKAQIVQISACSNATPKPAILKAAQTWLTNSKEIYLPERPDFCRASGIAMPNRISHWEAYWTLKPARMRVTYQWHWDNPAFLENALTRLNGLASMA